LFEALTNKLGEVFRGLGGRGRITETNVRDAMRQVRTALLEADVNFVVVKDFSEKVVQKALGAKVIESLHPGQVMIKIVYDELISLMGPVDSQIYFVSPGPTVVLLAGLQGSGKTTTAAKLANLLLKKGKHPLLVADDLQRPAAIEQLKTLGAQLGLPVYSEDGQDPVRVALNGVRHARQDGRDVVILDTAGRLHIDQNMMAEIRRLCEAVQPHQIYLVCDAMTGQDAVNSAKEFNDALELDGIILTKLDGDARGGAALSVKAVTGKPIKFVGLGEKLDRLEEFHPDRMASRILGMGDVVSLVEKAQEQYSVEEAADLQAKMVKGEFTFDDFLKQMQSMRRMGGIKDVLKLLPGIGGQVAGLDVDEHDVRHMEAIVHSMTAQERRRPEIIDASRRRRIARGSGADPTDVSSLVKTFEQSRQMMKALGGMGLMGRMKALKTMGSLDLFSGKLPDLHVRQRPKRRKLDRKRKKRSR